MKNLLHLGALASFAALIPAQSIIVPPAANGAEGNSSTSFPWNRAASAMRIQYIYDAAAFTSQGVNTPIEISSIKFRRQGNAAQVAGSYSGVTVQIATSLNDYLTPDLTFANNLAGDVQTVLNAGTVNLLPIVTPTAPNAYFVDIPVSPAFTYDPTAGDLVFDIELPAASYSGAGAGTTDYSFGPGHSCNAAVQLRRLGVATAENPEAGVVVEFDYTLVPNAAAATPYGSGCYDGLATWYESFTGATTPDISGVTGTSTNSVLMQNLGDRYSVVPGSNSYFTPTSPDLGLADDAVSSPQALPWSFSHPGGSTMDITISSNGFVWLDGTSTASDFSPTLGELVTEPARIAACWQDLSPQLTGASVHFDVDPSGNVVYVTFVAVPEFNQQNTNDLPGRALLERRRRIALAGHRHPDRRPVRRLLAGQRRPFGRHGRRQRGPVRNRAGQQPAVAVRRVAPRSGRHPLR